MILNLVDVCCHPFMRHFQFWLFAFSNAFRFHTVHQANVEPSDDMCLKKHLLYLKASKQRKSVKHDIEQPQESNVEQQMEDLCRIQEKLWKLKQVLSTIPEIVTKESEEVSLNGQIVVYVPVARLKEKE